MNKEKIEIMTRCIVMRGKLSFCIATISGAMNTIITIRSVISGAPASLVESVSDEIKAPALKTIREIIEETQKELPEIPDELVRECGITETLKKVSDSVTLLIRF